MADFMAQSGFNAWPRAECMPGRTSTADRVLRAFQASSGVPAFDGLIQTTGFKAFKLILTPRQQRKQYMKVTAGSRTPWRKGSLHDVSNTTHRPT